MSAPTPQVPISPKRAMIMAGGTGGHIFPALAVARLLRKHGWQVIWLGVPHGMEDKLVRNEGIAFEGISFSGLRKKGVSKILGLPLALAKACNQSSKILKKNKPDVLLGFGGYVSFPGGLMAKVHNIPLLIHEQNAIAGMANRWLSLWAHTKFAAFPDVIKNAKNVGMPLREAFINSPPPESRFHERSGALQILVLGGSLGAQILNDVVPKALAMMDPSVNIKLIHQSGEKHLQTLKDNYQDANIEAQTVAFIEDTAAAMLQADLLICRSGASTVMEIAAIGVASILVPYAYAVDDHQTINAQYLSNHGAAWLVKQNEFTPELLASLLNEIDRSVLLDKAIKARKLHKPEAAQAMVQICEEIKNT